MQNMRTKRASRETTRTQTVRRILPVLWTLLALSGSAKSAPALAPGMGGPKTTIVIFSDRPMAEPVWATLFAQLRHEAVAEARSTPGLDADPQLLKGIEVVPGTLTENPIVVKLHGDCRPPVGVRAFPSDAPLGWVRREEGRISSFVQVDCTRVAEVIAQRVAWMNDGEKSVAMCGAIARVILHEWIHIAEQSARHSHDGISKRAFGSADLVLDQQAASQRVRESASQRAGKPSVKSEPE
jgi:hypothetical protein